jgi:hypothetical protein
VPQSGSPPARSGHTASVYDFKIYVFGGADADYFYNDIWCFDTRALTWTPIPASGYLPTGRYGHSSALVDGVLYIFGGNSPDGTELNDAYAFKIKGKQSLDSLQATIRHDPRQWHWLIILWFHCVCQLFLERRWYLFQNEGPAPTPRSGHTMCTVKDRVFVLGGEAGQRVMDDTAQIYYLELCK